MADYTSGPWRWVERRATALVLIGNGDHAVAHMAPSRRQPAKRADADRIVACVNACDGINPEAVPDLLAACEAASREISAAVAGGHLAHLQSGLHATLRAAIDKSCPNM